MATYNYNEIAKRTRNLYNHAKEGHPFDVVLIQYDNIFVTFYGDAKTLINDANELLFHLEANFVVVLSSNLGKVVKRVIFKTACNIHIV